MRNGTAAAVGVGEGVAGNGVGVGLAVGSVEAGETVGIGDGLGLATGEPAYAMIRVATAVINTRRPNRFNVGFATRCHTTAP